MINDSSDVISRRHAVINVANNGKLTITDTSYNGTYVNGIRIAPNVPVPVTRKDSVTFAHVAKLDWKLIPKPALMRWLLPGGIAAGVLVVVGVVCAVCFLGSKTTTSDSSDDQPVAVADSTIQEKTDSAARKENSSAEKESKVSNNKEKTAHDKNSSDQKGKAASRGKQDAAKSKKTNASASKQSAPSQKNASLPKQHAKPAESKEPAKVAKPESPAQSSTSQRTRIH